VTFWQNFQTGIVNFTFWHKCQLTRAHRRRKSYLDDCQKQMSKYLSKPRTCKCKSD